MSDDWIRLPSYILDELRSVALHLPFASFDLRRAVSSTIYATDATPTSGGACCAKVPSSLAEKLAEFAENKGCHVRLDGSNLESQKLSFRCPEIGDVGKCVQWQTISSYSFRRCSHVNLQETRAVFRELRDFSKGPLTSPVYKDLVFLVDSEVALGAIVKGRSSSFKLNVILGNMIGYFLALNIGLRLVVLPSGCNPADAPSRFFGIEKEGAHA